jgi:hypothetical protein
MSDDQRHELLIALLWHFMPNRFKTLLQEACDQAVREAPQDKSRFQRGDPVALPTPEPSSENTRYAALSHDSGLRAIPDGNEYSGPGRSPARAATLSARDISSDRPRRGLTHERKGGAISAHARASEPPHALAGDPANSAREPAQPEIVNGRIPVNPLLGPLLGDVLATGHGPITQEILRRSQLRNPLVDFPGYDPSLARMRGADTESRAVVDQ